LRLGDVGGGEHRIHRLRAELFGAADQIPDRALRREIRLGVEGHLVAMATVAEAVNHVSVCC
jgi:hypothetical protein